MKAISRKMRTTVGSIFLGLLVGAASFWLSHGRDNTRAFEGLKKNALCVLNLPAGSPGTSAVFTTTRPVDQFHVGIKPNDKEDFFSLSISGDRGLVASVSGVKSTRFSFGRAIPPGTYTVNLGQSAQSNGALVVIAGEEPVFVSGWQIWSRTYLALFALAAICVLLTRKSRNTRIRTLSLSAFHAFLLGFVLIFTYLLFHEGGHALAQIAFGRFSLARSDFWGIHGHPHSGGIMGPSLTPWQQGVISCAGPMMPTFAGLALFLLWVSPIGRRLRNSGQLANLYSSAIVAMLVFPQVVVGPFYALGLITDEGDLNNVAATTGGSVFFARSLLFLLFLLSLFVLWRVAPQLLKAWKAQFMEARCPSGSWMQMDQPTQGRNARQ